MKYIAYARKSTDEKDKQVLSIDNQISELKEFAERENLEIVDFLTEAQSAKVTGRPIFNSLVKRIEKGEAQGIVSWNPDRIARNSIDGGKIIYLLDTGELQSLKFPTHWFENTPQGRFMLSIAFGQAKYYVDNLSQNVHRGLKYKIKMGVWPALAPWGYKNDRNLKTVVLDPLKANVIKKAFELYATGKYTLHDMCMYFYENGIRERNTGEPPETTTIREVFKRPFYYGYMLYNGELYQGTHTPIITKDTFDKVQLVIQKRGWFHTKLFRAPRYDFAFTGFIKCHYCNCSVTAESRPFFFPKTNNKVNYLYYHCTKKKGECCQKGYTREEILEVQFREIIKSLSVSQGWVDQMNNFLVQNVESQKVEDKNTSLSLETEISQTEQKLDTLLEAYLDTVIDSESYIKKKNELMERKANLVSKQKELTSDNPNWIEAVTNFITCAQKCAKIARAENNCHDLADMAKKVGSKYFLKDKKIEFCLYFPYNLLAANGGAASFPAQSVPTLAFGQSKYYIDNLSENIKRGHRAKLRKGIWPNFAPLGYSNNPKTRAIDIDSEKAPLVRKAFELYATGEYTLKAVAIILEQAGLRSYKGNVLSVSCVQRLLQNPIYYGVFSFNGEIYDGTHEPIISKKLFDSVAQVMSNRGKKKRKRKHEFAFSGLMKCGNCDCLITAEKQKGHHYYRCTKKKQTCNEKYLREENLVEQMKGIIQKVSLPDDWANNMLAEIDKEKEQAREETKVFVQNLQTKKTEIEAKTENLLDLFIGGKGIEPEEYQAKKLKLLNEKQDILGKIRDFEQKGNNWLEPMKEMILASSQAKILLSQSDNQEIRAFLKNIGSNFILKDKKFQFALKNGWRALAEGEPTKTFPNWR